MVSLQLEPLPDGLMAAAISHLKIKAVYFLIKGFHHEEHEAHEVVRGSIRILFDIFLCDLRDLRGFKRFCFSGCWS